MIVTNSVTPKAAAKHELLFNKPTSGASVGWQTKLFFITT